ITIGNLNRATLAIVMEPVALFSETAHRNARRANPRSMLSRSINSTTGSQHQAKRARPRFRLAGIPVTGSKRRKKDRLVMSILDMPIDHPPDGFTQYRRVTRNHQELD